MISAWECTATLHRIQSALPGIPIGLFSILGTWTAMSVLVHATRMRFIERMSVLYYGFPDYADPSPSSMLTVWVVERLRASSFSSWVTNCVSRLNLLNLYSNTMCACIAGNLVICAGHTISSHGSNHGEYAFFVLV